MKKNISYISFLLFCLLFSNRSEAIVTNVSLTKIFATEDYKFDVNNEANAPFQFILNDDREEKEDLFCDDEFDDTDDDCHQKATKESAIIDNEFAFFSTQTTLVTFSSKQQIKLFILLCSLKLHC
jgi:hypothetical protein